MSSQRTMITFSRGDRCFHCRVAGIALSNNCVLLHREEGELFWTFPGGRAEIGETAAQTLAREIKEELNEEIEIIRLLWLVENYFNYAQKNYHEIAFYFLMQFPERSLYLNQDQSFQGVEEGKRMEYKWFSINFDVLNELPLLPSFLQQSLSSLPSSVEHIVHRD